MEPDAKELIVNRPNGRKLRYVLEGEVPPAAPSEPEEAVIDEERWAYLTLGGYWCVSGPDFQADTLRGLPAPAPVRVHVINKSKYDAMVEELERLRDSERQAVHSFEALTRERDEAQATIGPLRAELDSLRERGRADISRIAELERQVAFRDDRIDEMQGMLADKASRIADLERQVAEANEQPAEWQAAIERFVANVYKLYGSAVMHEHFVAHVSRFAAAEFGPKMCVDCREGYCDVQDAMRDERWAGDWTLETAGQHCFHVRDPEHRCIASGRTAAEACAAANKTVDLDAPAPSPASGPDEGWVGQVIDELGTYIEEKASILWTHDWSCKLASLLRRHAPAQRYPEVCEFLDRFGTCGWSLTYNPNGDPSRLASAWTSGTRRDVHFDRPTIAAACRAALEAKERADAAV